MSTALVASAAPRMKDASRILVVDDDPGIGTMLTRALERHGYEVDATTSADEALEMAESANYDAAIVDLVMPEPNQNENSNV